ncbi:response regulator [Hydrogenophaga sp.]|uniref:response regulator n=1 Tax=Hydrogenophaga sp. TaxID=1904254 RepID=UPI00286E73BD|nr:response regulator [Hydrogenophaga sp.]
MRERAATVAPAPPGPTEVAALLADLRRRFTDQLGPRLDSVRRQLQQLLAGDGVVDLESLHREVHGLTGGAGTFGLPEVSAAARGLEATLAALVRGDAVLDTAQAQAMAQALAALERAAAAPRAAGAGVPVPPTAEPSADAVVTVHLLRCALQGADGEDWSALSAAGYRVQAHTDFAALCQAWAHTPPPVPTVLLLDMHDPAVVEPALAQVQALTAGPARPVVVAALPHDDLDLRLRALRAGVQRTLARPLEPERMVDVLDTLTGRRPAQPYRVLLVDDEPLLLEAQATVLRGAGMEVHALSDPLQTLDILERLRPDVLLLDVYMPEASGPELAAALRERDAWLDLPVIFLSAETDLTQQLLALNLGGDDFLVKPVQPDHLVAAVTARARRARQGTALRRHLQTTLYEREREHMALGQHASVSFADQAGNISYANERFCQNSGYSFAELQGHNHRMLKSGVHAPEFYQGIWSAIASGQVWHGELCSRRKDGSLYWVESTITPFVDREGRVYQFVSIQTDISHIKAAEAALRAQRDMQRVISLSAAALMAVPLVRTHEAIDQALQASGLQLGADRAHLYTIARDGRRFNGEHVWCAPGITPMPGDLQDVAQEHMPWLLAHLNRDLVLCLPDVQQLPPADAAPQALLQRCGVRSLLVFALRHEGRPIGFLAYSLQHAPRHWSDEDIALLKVLRDVIGSALVRTWADAALRRSEARLHFLVASSPVTIFTAEARHPWALRYVSPNVQQLMGHASEAFTREAGLFARLVHPDDCERVARERPDVLVQGDALIEFRLRMHDGRYRWLHEQSRLVRDEAGQPLEIIGYWMDITERKLIEAELSRFNQELEQRVAEQTRNVIESERLAQATLDALSARVVILDAQGDIVAANQAWRDFGGGRSTGDIRNYLDYCATGAGTGNTQFLAPLVGGIRSVMDGTARSFEHEYSAPIGGDTHWFVCRVERFGAADDPRVVVSHEDITAMKRAERQQLRSQRLESLGTLAGGVAHDLNNALAPVLMGMSILKEQYPEESKLFEMIQGSAQRGADMVRQLLTFAKGVEGERVPVRPQPMLDELERLMKGSFPKNIQLRVACDDGLPPVLGDPTQLHQVLLNLCVNARDAMPGGGTLGLRAKVVVLDDVYARSIPDARPGRYVALRVSDTGSGIPPEILDRIFDPFFTTKAADKGTGLGLSTVLGIVRAHGGFVQVYSQLAQGTMFTVCLPVAANDVGDVRDSVPFAESVIGEIGHGETILFVDDEPAVREVGRTVLERLKFKPVLATDGADALLKTAAHQAQLRAVITDLHMPQMDGLAFVIALRRMLPEVPVIVASGRVDEAAAAELQRLGVTRRLDKPFTQEQLARALRAVLGG